MGFARHLDVARATGLARDLDAGLATMLGEALGTVGDLRDWMTQTLDPNRDTRAGLTDSDTSLLLARSILIELTLGNAVDLARHLDLGQPSASPATSTHPFTPTASTSSSAPPRSLLIWPVIWPTDSTPSTPSQPNVNRTPIPASSPASTSLWICPTTSPLPSTPKR